MYTFIITLYHHDVFEKKKIVYYIILKKLTNEIKILSAEKQPITQD